MILHFFGVEHFMDQYGQEQRHAAAKAFIKSLDQLQETLQSTDSRAASPPRSRRSEPCSPAQFDLNSFEQAVADIEQFMERQKDNG